MTSRNPPILLLGGSFNPAHAGHLALSQFVLAQLGLDKIWWLVAAQNPLKEKTGMAPFTARLARAQAIAKTDPRITISGIENEIATQYSIDTVLHLQTQHPQQHFIWVMGADNIGQFHRWHRYQEFAQLLPIIIVPRPGETAQNPALGEIEKFRFCGPAAMFAAVQPPAWLWLDGFADPHSSTAIRAEMPQDWWE